MWLNGLIIFHRIVKCPEWCYGEVIAKVQIRTRLPRDAYIFLYIVKGDLKLFQSIFSVDQESEKFMFQYFYKWAINMELFVYLSQREEAIHAGGIW